MIDHQLHNFSFFPFETQISCILFPVKWEHWLFSNCAKGFISKIMSISLEKNCIKWCLMCVDAVC